MKAYLKLAALSLTLLCGACQPNDGWQQLFNGKDFTGFKQLNGKAPYRVDIGCILIIKKKKILGNLIRTELECHRKRSTTSLYGQIIRCLIIELVFT